MITFAVFNSPKFSIFNKKIGTTEYKLGWVPLGIYIELLGADAHSYEKLNESEKEFALLSKPKWQRSVFKLIPFLGIIAYFIVSGFLSNDPFIFYSRMPEVIIKFFQTVFGFTSYEETELLAQKIIQVHGLYSFIFFAGAFIYISAKLMDLFSQLLFETEKHLIFKIIGFLYMILMLWFMLWKVPSFFLHYFSVSDILISIISYLAGIILSGILFYLLVIGVLRSRSV